MTDNSDLDKLAIEAMRELQAMYDYPDREPADLDIGQLQKFWYCSRSTADTRMRKLVEDGLWHGLYVRGINNQRVFVYRKGPKPEKK